MTIELEKHPKSIMVAGGVSSYGVVKLIFVLGPWIYLLINKLYKIMKKILFILNNLELILSFNKIMLHAI